MSIAWSRINGLLGDPAIYAFLSKSGEGLLFDLGTLDALPNRDLLKVRTALISHTHIDHFIGFDRWLRVNIPHHRELELLGPPGLLANVRGKLAGYRWNLLDPDQLRFVVHELTPHGEKSSFALRNQTGFEPEPLTRPPPQLTPIDAPLPAPPAACLTTLSDGTRIHAVVLDHGTPSVAYMLQGPCRFQTKTDVLTELGLKPGSWIRDVQYAIIEQRTETTVTIDQRNFRVADLAQQLFEIRRPKPLGYITDAGFTAPNLQRIGTLLTGVETLICEANYRDEDFAKARAKMHLTTRQAALIAAYIQADHLEIFHISNLYANAAEAVISEAAAFFDRFRQLSPDDLASAIAMEYQR